MPGYRTIVFAVIAGGLFPACTESNWLWRPPDAAFERPALGPEAPPEADAAPTDAPFMTDDAPPVGADTSAVDGSPAADADPAEVAPDATSSPPELRVGLVGHWALDEGPGTATVADSSGAGHHGAVTTTPLSAAWEPGKKGWALQVPDQHGAGARIAATDRINAVRRFTISAWVKRLAPSSSDLHAGIVSRQDGTASRDVYILAFHRDNLVAWIYTTPTTGPVNVRGNRTVPVGEWLHLAVTYDGATVTLYQQGEPVGSRAHVTELPSNSHPLYIGNNVNNGVADQPLGGLIDEVRLYDRALSRAEIQLVMADAP